jgi:hypothetical protein
VRFLVEADEPLAGALHAAGGVTQLVLVKMEGDLPDAKP